MKKTFKKIHTIAIIAIPATLAAASAHAEGFVDLTGVTVDTSALTSLAALTVPVLLGLLVYRKVVKSSNRS